MILLTISLIILLSTNVYSQSDFCNELYSTIIPMPIENSTEVRINGINKKFQKFTFQLCI